MRVLVTGAYGLIGAACLARLRRDGHSLIGAGREIRRAQRMFPYARWIRADFHKLTTPQSWYPLIEGIDAVVNCVGALQDGARDDLQRIHVAAPAALFTACEQKGIRRVVHVSAIGAEPDGATAFARTKAETERDLMSRHLEWIILRPGLVLADGVYGGTAMLRGAAGVPGVTPVIDAGNPIQVVALDDVAETVAWAMRAGAAFPARLDLVHPKSATLGHLAAAYRLWLGLRSQPVVVVPGSLARATARFADALAWLGWRSPMRTTALVQLGVGIVGDPADWMARTGLAPRSLDDILSDRPSTVQDRWFARLYMLKPIAIAVLALFWIASGAIALGPGWREAVGVMRDAGAGEQLATIATAGGAVADILLGCGLLVRRFSRAALIGMLILSLGYVVGAVVLAPSLFADPLGRIVKIFPIMLAIAFVLAVLDER